MKITGFNDFDSGYQRKKIEVVEYFSNIAEKFGAHFIETPMMEYSNQLGKYLPDQDRPNQGIFSLRDDENDPWKSLRYDLTSPLARFYRENCQQLQKPFKTYRYGEVFRNEKPEKNRFRQFVQFDMDIVGAQSIWADIENINFAIECLKKTQLDFTVNVNSRKLVDCVLNFFNVEKKLETIRIIDKFYKNSEEIKEKLIAIGIQSDVVEKLVDYFENPKDLDDDEYVQTKKQIDFVISKTPNTIFNATIMRGLEYYTGLVYEIFCSETTKSIGGGGRYDELIEIENVKVPATGISLGISRILELTPNPKVYGPILVTCMEQEQEEYYYSIVNELRICGFPAEMFIGERTNFKNQIKYGDRISSPIAIIIGERERLAQTVTLKFMLNELTSITDTIQYQSANSQTQIEISRGNLIAYVSEYMRGLL